MTDNLIASSPASRHGADAAITDRLDQVSALLGRPFRTNGLELPNRIVMAPMTRMQSPDGIPGEDVASYYARRAAAGVGLIVTEGTYIAHPSAGGSDRVPRFHGGKQIAGWRSVVDAVHAEGGRIFPQLWHLGTMRNAGEPPYPEALPLGPSGLGLDGSQTGTAMTTQDIDDVITAFADAAATAESLGFDGVEVHGAHGYLIDQFFWPATNLRTDSYGGAAENRAKFAVEVVAAIRSRVSPSFPVHFRFSQQKTFVWEARIAETPHELEALLLPLAEAGVDAFHASTRRYWEPEFEGASLNLAGWAKKVTGKPAITVGSVGLQGEYVGALFNGESSNVRDISDLRNPLEDDEYDLVAVGRALAQDPEWARKVLDRRFDELQAFSRSSIDTLT